MNSRKSNGKRTIIGLIAFCLALGGCQVGSPLPPSPLPSSPGSSPGSSAISATVFFSTVSDPQSRSSINTFEVSELRDLFVFVAWEAVDGQHTQALEFILPDGNLYQRLEVEFDMATAPTSQEEPMTVAALPVAGTFITKRLLLGNWTVAVFLDDQFITQADFTLEPDGA